MVTPDGKSVFVANHLPLDRADGDDVAASVTAIDTATQQATRIRLPNGSTSVRGMCLSPDGRYVYVVHILAHYQLPTTQLERGWMNTNALSIIDAAAKRPINTVLLDDVDLGAANSLGRGHQRRRQVALRHPCRHARAERDRRRGLGEACS